MLQPHIRNASVRLHCNEAYVYKEINCLSKQLSVETCEEMLHTWVYLINYELIYIQSVILKLMSWPHTGSALKGLMYWWPKHMYTRDKLHKSRIKCGNT